MPFGTCEWVDGRPQFDLNKTPLPELRQTDARSFVLLASFCYQDPRGAGDTVYVVPGEDTPEEIEDPNDNVVIPPDRGGLTDLASVPSFMWWLIASYGNHTRASLLHDALYVDEGEPPVPRKTADALFLTALREPEQKTGTFRHWLMWAAVSAFGTMRHRLGILFGVHVLAVWGLVIAAVAWAWGPAIWEMSWTWWSILLAVLAPAVFLVLLGTSWRAGVDLTGGWLSPIVITAAVVLVPLVVQWTWPFKVELSPFTLLVSAAALMILGPLWGLCVDPTLRGWLWPTALIGLPIALIPVALIFLAVRLVWLIDFGAALAAWPRRDKEGQRRGFKVPSLKPYRLPL